MQSLGNYIVRGRIQAIGVVGFSSLFSVLLPPFAYVLSGVPVVLVTLRRGALSGFEVIAGSALLASVLSLLVGLDYMVVVAFTLAIWLPIYTCSIVLRQTESQGAMVMTAGVIGFMFVLLMYAILGDVTAWWREWLDVWFLENLPPENASEYKKIFAAAVPMLNALMAAGLVVSLVCTTLLGRWWQARLFNPGGFRAEFYSLSLPRWLAIPTMLSVLVLFVANEGISSIVRDCLFVVVFLYLFQGISSIHRVVHAREMSQSWLVFMYGLLFIVPQMVLFLACIGMADAWKIKGNRSGNNQS